MRMVRIASGWTGQVSKLLMMRMRMLMMRLRMIRCKQMQKMVIWSMLKMTMRMMWWLEWCGSECGRQVANIYGQWQCWYLYSYCFMARSSWYLQSLIKYLCRLFWGKYPTAEKSDKLLEIWPIQTIVSLVSDRAGSKTNIIKSVLFETMSEWILTQNCQILHIFQDGHIHQTKNSLPPPYIPNFLSIILNDNECLL